LVFIWFCACFFLLETASVNEVFDSCQITFSGTALRQEAGISTKKEV
jgi:hypothetical protein